MRASYRDDLLEMCERRFASYGETAGGKMMGHPGFKLIHNNKFFLFLYEDGITLKMPPGEYEKLLERQDMTGFQPMNDKKPMSTWVVWTLAEPDEYENEWEIIETALNFTANEPPNIKKK